MKGTNVLLSVALGASVGLTALAPASSAPSGSELRVVSSLPLPGADAAKAKSTVKSAQPSSCPAPPRSTKDRKDIRKGPLVHVVYLLSSDSNDAHIDTDGTLECSMRGQQHWLRKQSGLQWRLDTTIVNAKVPGSNKRRKVELVDVSFLKSDLRSEELTGAGVVQGELEAAGLDEDGKRYLTYVEGTGGGSCGDAFWPFESNLYGSDGKFAQVYLNSVEGCMADKFGTATKPSFSETIAQQEIMHNDGIVPIGAPHGCGPLSLPAHVCTGPLVFVDGLDPERFDILYPFVGLPLSEKKLDIDNDDYFRTDLPLTDLEESVYLEKWVPTVRDVRRA